MDRVQATWARALDQLADRGHYMDRVMGELKQRAYLELIERWGGVPSEGWMLKTDMFEEAAGPDAFALAFVGRGAQIVGMDVSIAAIRQAARTCRPCGIRCLAADARLLPFDDDVFSLVISPSTLDHFERTTDLGVALRELARILKPDGRLIITLDNRENVTDPLLRLASWFGVIPYYLGRSYTVRELCEELRQAGFRVEDTTAIIQHPRLLAVVLTRLVGWIGWSPAVRLVEQGLTYAQRLERTRWRYRLGCFVAAKAIPMKAEAALGRARMTLRGHST